MKKILLFVAFVLGFGVSVFAWDDSLNTAKNAPYLSEVEKQVIFELNKARSNPARFAKEYLEPMVGQFNGKMIKKGNMNMMTNEGVAAVNDAINALKAQKAVSPLQPSKGLSKAAQDFAKEQSQTGAMGHNGKDGSTMKSRIESNGKWQKTIGENINYGSANANQIVVDLIIDDGVPTRGHRKNIYNDNYKVVGIGVNTHPKYKNVCVMDFAGGFSN
ncbi:hypothetical protein CCY99_03780 [Helicobacter sp. 16-1353]|uniref:CAP domain-containing protein n=1 Tax=Helicobacter sp. 16-1353 TaxID=2004996 RepID=UPI000DCB0E9C|nr:CAP domain-containing protein [Helicobacter sp. 16-1353]RAX54478.1 hypothetical protein CCY99_03780 [Helicobacter sp. 16-1353]